MKITVGKILILLITLSLTSPLFSEIPDNSPARRELADLVLAPVNTISVGQGRVIEDRYSGELVKFEVQRDRDSVVLMFLNERDGSFPYRSSGNVGIQRNLSNGEIQQVKIYLDDIGALVLRLRPSGQRSVLTLSLFDHDLYTNILLGVSLEKVLGMDVDSILEMTRGRIPWDELFPPEDVGQYDDLLLAVSRLQVMLPLLPDADDGAMDENGNLVRIETLKINSLPGFNCSGFAKYVSDGVFDALTGRYMSIGELKTKHPEDRGNDISLEYEEQRDPYFGLDWTRNIATAIARAWGEPVSSPEDEDVRGLDFFSYTEDVGYAVSDLRAVLYLQTIRDPGKFYLGSINGEFGKDPVLWQHYHVVVLFPYFDDNGVFHVTVMERNVQSSVPSLQRRYPKEYIHLVGIEPADQYNLQELPGMD